MASITPTHSNNFPSSELFLEGVKEHLELQKGATNSIQLPEFFMEEKEVSDIKKVLPSLSHKQCEELTPLNKVQDLKGVVAKVLIVSDATDSYFNSAAHIAIEKYSIAPTDESNLCLFKLLVLLRPGLTEWKTEHKSYPGYDPLCFACSLGAKKIVEFLVSVSTIKKEAKVDINSRTDDKSTPLHIAVEEGHIAIAHLLKEKGADLSLLNGDGLTAAQLAIVKAEEEVDTLQEKAFGDLAKALNLEEKLAATQSKPSEKSENQNG